LECGLEQGYLYIVHILARQVPEFLELGVGDTTGNPRENRLGNRYDNL